MVTPRDAGRVVIVGGGLAGYSAAETLRQLDHPGPITIIDTEPALYDRPPLSKRLFEDGFTLDSVVFAGPDALAARRIDTRFGTSAVALDPWAAAVELDDGSSIEADTVLLATGGRARRMPIPGSDLRGVLVLRTFADAAGLRSRIAPGTRVAVIGGGLIGAELASSLVDAGARVTIIDPASVPLVAAVGQETAERLHTMHTERGIDVVVGIAERIEQDASGLVVFVDCGMRIAASVVVVGIGIVPNTELAHDAGLLIDNGVLVDENQRTSAPRVFAAGDVSRLRDGSGTSHRREEHWEAAQLSGRRAAHGMLGLPTLPSGAPWFWSDRHGVHVEAVGRLTGPGEVVQRPGALYPSVFLVDDGLLMGAVTIDDSATVRAARRLIDQRIPVSASELADPKVTLRSLLRVHR